MAVGPLTHFNIRFTPFCSGLRVFTLPNFAFLRGFHFAISSHLSQHSSESMSSMVSQIDLVVGLSFSPYVTAGSRVQSLIVFKGTPAFKSALPKASRSAL